MHASFRPHYATNIPALPRSNVSPVGEIFARVTEEAETLLRGSAGMFVA